MLIKHKSQQRALTSFISDALIACNPSNHVLVNHLALFLILIIDPTNTTVFLSSVPSAVNTRPLQPQPIARPHQATPVFFFKRVRETERRRRRSQDGGSSVGHLGGTGTVPISGFCCYCWIKSATVSASPLRSSCGPVKVNLDPQAVDRRARACGIMDHKQATEVA